MRAWEDGLKNSLLGSEMGLLPRTCEIVTEIYNKGLSNGIFIFVYAGK